MSYICPVCGYPCLCEPPRDPETGGGSYEICPSCGFEFGVSDDDRGYTYDEWRARWVAQGMHWSGRNPPPAGWDPSPADWDPHRQLAALTEGKTGSCD